MRKTIQQLIFGLTLFLAGTLLLAEDAKTIIKKMDLLMCPGAKSKINLVFTKQDGNKSTYGLISYTKDLNQKIIVRFTAPPSQIGNDLIMLDKNVWSYEKEADRIMKIASNKSFGGTGFSYGDVVRLNMSDNYTAEIKTESDSQWTLLLTAIERTAPYYQIELIIKKDGYIPVKAICYTNDSKIVKTIEYLNLKKFNDLVKPSRLLIKSPFSPNEYSEMIIEEELLKDFPDNIFNKRNLSIRQEEKY